MAVIDLSGVKFPIVSLTKAQYEALATKEEKLYLISDATGADTTIYYAAKAVANTQSGTVGVVVESIATEVQENKDVALKITFTDSSTQLVTLFNQEHVVDAIELDDTTKEIVVTDGAGTETRLPLAPVINESIGNPVMGVSYVEATQALTFTHKDATTTVVDLPLESVIQSVAYDDETHMLTFTLVSGSTTQIDLSDLVPIAVTTIDENTDAAAIPTVQAVVDLLAQFLAIGSV